MTILEAAVLGVVQGVTEFLPISSTAHLRLVPALLGWSDPGAAFTAVIQLGSLVAVVGYFLSELLRMLRAAAAAAGDPARRADPDARRLLYLVAGTIPVGIAGLALRHAIEGGFRSPPVIGAALVVVGLGLGLVEARARRDRAFTDFTLRDALLVGVAQACAIVPGVSRSGVTLLAGMALGFRRDAAARFSFLLSVPAVAAAGVFELPKALRTPGLDGVALGVGLTLAAVSSWLTIAWLLKFLATHTTRPFVVYRVALGAAVVALWAAGLVR